MKISLKNGILLKVTSLQQLQQLQILWRNQLGESTDYLVEAFELQLRLQAFDKAQTLIDSIDNSTNDQALSFELRGLLANYQSEFEIENFQHNLFEFHFVNSIFYPLLEVTRSYLNSILFVMGCF